MSDAWQLLQEELQQWHEPVKFWWRDDDAVADTVALQQLIALQQKNHTIPLHLASIPQLLEASLPPLVHNSPHVWILQHGYNHQNNALEGQRKIELGGNQDIDTLNRKLASGRKTLQQHFPDRFIDIVVPPWNRVDATALSAIAQLDYRAVSGLGLKDSTGGLTPELNIHVDIIDWRQRCFVGTEQCLDKVVQQLKTRRTTTPHRHTPLGLMTHHLDHDQGCWEFLSEFLLFTSNHFRIEWIHAGQFLSKAH